jgi:large subunit ribosomal protein L16
MGWKNLKIFLRRQRRQENQKKKQKNQKKKNNKKQQEGIKTMLMPKRVKYRKAQRGRMKGKAKGGTEVSFGEFGLRALEPSWITSQQIEAARMALTRYLKKGGKLWVRIFPDKPVTKTAAETRMGKGKGSPEYWVSVVKPGRVMFELEGVTLDIAKEAMSRAAHKLPIKTKFIQRQEI